MYLIILQTIVQTIITRSLNRGYMSVITLLTPAAFIKSPSCHKVTYHMYNLVVNSKL